jgi:hypothetical protein
VVNEDCSDGKSQLSLYDPSLIVFRTKVPLSCLEPTLRSTVPVKVTAGGALLCKKGPAVLADDELGAIWS